jgi:hypothetical protein
MLAHRPLRLINGLILIVASAGAIACTEEGHSSATASAAIAARGIAAVNPAPQPAAPGYFITNAMVMAAYPFYNRPYPNDPGNLVQEGDMIVYRPNHGIAHSVRKAAVTQDLLALLLANPNGGEMQAWLKTKVAADPTYHQKLALIALLSRSGRFDESDAIPAATRLAEMQAGADNFKTVVSEVGAPTFMGTELNDFAQAIILDGGSSANVDQDHLSRFLRSCHDIELIRLDMQQGPNIQALVPEVTQANLDELYRREALYLTATGDVGDEQYQDPFYELSTHPSELLQTIVNVRASFTP